MDKSGVLSRANTRYGAPCRTKADTASNKNLRGPLRLHRGPLRSASFGKPAQWAFLLALLLALGGAGCGPASQPVVIEPFELSVVVQWNEAALAAIRSGPPRPTVISRSMFMLHAAMYDAWAMYDATAVSLVIDPALRRPRAEHTPANKEAAVSQAAYQMLTRLFPIYEAKTRAFSRLMEQLGHQVVTLRDPQTPAGIGVIAARELLAAREADGSNAAQNFADVTSAVYPILYAPVNSAVPEATNAPTADGFNPNHWQPLRVPRGKLYDPQGYPIADPADPDSYDDQEFMTPHWGAVTPFALTSGSQFRPPAPARYGSDEPYTDAHGRTMSNDAAYRLQVQEVLEISANLTDDQKVMAEYWADGPRSETPPGHWNAIAHGVSFRDRHTLDEDVKLYFALNAALFDGGISCWDAKRAYDYVRPQSAIHHLYAGQRVAAWAGPDLGTRFIPAETWRPYQALDFVTPAFPEYVSGHSTFSAVAATVLRLFTGSDQFYDGVTVLAQDYNRDGVPDLLGQHIVPAGSNEFESGPMAFVVLQWETFSEAADEAGLSRLYGGIHFHDGDLRGRAMGREIGAQAYALAERYWSGK
jgi:hypothetical protein